MHRIVERPRLRPMYLASIHPTTRAHLDAMAHATPTSVLSDNAYLALMLIAASSDNIIIDAYTHAGGAWVVEIHGYPWQECRYSPAQWQAMYEQQLAQAVESGYMPLADVWRAVYRQLALTFPNGQMLPDGPEGSAA